jgi:hypothetical protein
MTKQLPKLVLSSSRDIPFSQLVLSQKNVRRVKAGLSIEDLAEDIYRRTLLQSLNVRPIVGEDGHETGMFEVPAGGRRFRALELLVKSKRMAKDQPVPCVVREAGIAEEDSLAENVMRVGLHPLDQFRAFSALIERASARMTSLRASSSRSRRCASVCGLPRSRPACSTSTARTACRSNSSWPSRSPRTMPARSRSGSRSAGPTSPPPTRSAAC